MIIIYEVIQSSRRPILSHATVKIRDGSMLFEEREPLASMLTLTYAKKQKNLTSFFLLKQIKNRVIF